ncbi:hypothetical protein H4582DRAFT_2132621 [Lactarius indigo]|nr:hypothetical protein H4582DRAFT_2132621 [Lactarius indigo]
MVDDGYDTSIDLAGQWVDYWLIPLHYSTTSASTTPHFGLPHLNETETTHFSLLSNVEENWGHCSLGCGDTYKTLSNVYSFVPNATGYTNLEIFIPDIPLTITTGIISGPHKHRGRSHLCRIGLDTSFTTAKAPAPVNLTAQGKTMPWLRPRVAAASSDTSSSGSGNGVVGSREGMVGGMVPGILLTGVMMLLLA